MELNVPSTNSKVIEEPYATRKVACTPFISDVFYEGRTSDSFLLNMLLNLNKVNKITILAPMDSLGKL